MFFYIYFICFRKLKKKRKKLLTLFLTDYLLKIIIRTFLFFLWNKENKTKPNQSPHTTPSNYFFLFGVLAKPYHTREIMHDCSVLIRRSWLPHLILVQIVFSFQCSIDLIVCMGTCFVFFPRENSSIYPPTCLISLRCKKRHSRFKIFRI